MVLQDSDYDEDSSLVKKAKRRKENGSGESKSERKKRRKTLSSLDSVEGNMSTVMDGIRSTVVKITKLAAWAGKNNKGHDDICRKVIGYLNKIGSYIQDQESNGQDGNGMWHWTATLCKYDKGGPALQALYESLVLEQNGVDRL